MMRFTRPLTLVTILAAVCLSITAHAASARDILRETGVDGGFIVHLGCGGGKLTVALRVDERYTVHGLDADAERVETARRRISRRGLYGPVSIEQLDGDTLPYADNLINLVVVSDAGSVPMGEIMRVLVPEGVAYIKADGGWGKVVKPRPDDIDDWSHFLHDAGNNPVAADTVVGPPTALQWVAPPLFLRSHETPSGIEALVTAGGRIFYFFDEGLMGITDQRIPERWSLICRDAFNGKLLWKRELSEWGWPEWADARFRDKDWTEITGARTVVPNENHRRIVAEDNRVYVTLGYGAPLSILDAATGEILSTVEETMPAREIVVADGIAVVASRDLPSAAAKRRGDEQAPPAALAAVRGATGEVLWQKNVGAVKGLFLACDDGRAIYQVGQTLAGIDLTTGDALWQVEPLEKKGKALIACDGVVLVRGNRSLEAREGATGDLLWQKKVEASTGGFEGQDLYVIDGVAWPGMVSVDEGGKIVGKSAHVRSVGYDLRTGEETKRITVENLRSPEHHHRCYRNKATSRFLISSLEGIELLDLQADDHEQHNWLRGVCKLGIMPANGMLYVPSDQCFCEPGAKLLGFAAVSSTDTASLSLPDSERLTKGEAYGSVTGSGTATAGDWPTYRHDPARHGATSSSVGGDLSQIWRAELGGGLTQPVAAGDRVYVASRDAHTIHALHLATGRTSWTFVAGGRIDSPPTIHGDALLLGSADGSVYCLRAADGKLVWRFLAAPVDRRVAFFDQLESAWPVHGSVLVRDSVAYFTAGRSTYIDGGISAYAVDALTGELLNSTTLEGPFPDLPDDRDVSFYVEGANSDVLVSEGDSIFMRQKQLTPELEEVTSPILTTKGEMDTGLHVFSTSGMLDGSWYNRTFWMYSKRWPGFQLANQAPKSGQLLVIDESTTYGAKVFYHRNVHSPMFFPGEEGYLIFADHNTTEPQIVGEEGSREPVAWLPQSGYARRDGERTLDSPAYGLDKMIGYTRADPPLWAEWVSVRPRAMVKAGDRVFVAGPPDVFDPDEPYVGFEGGYGARLVTLAADDGRQVSEVELDTSPVFDGLIAARGRLLASLEDGSVVCLGGR